MKIIWFTGLSGSGKTTLSKLLAKKLHRKFKVKIIDGDIFRKRAKNTQIFTKKNIRNNNLKIIDHIFKLKNKYDFIIVSVISPLSDTRAKARRIFKKNYFEITVQCSLRELIKRDTKGLYKLAKENKMKNLIGYKSKILYEKSKYKTLKINTHKLTKTNAIKNILKIIL